MGMEECVPGVRKPARMLRAGRCCRCRSVAVGPAAARPDQAEGLAAFVVEQVGVDRRGEARIVELDREIIAALGGALRPGSTDLGAADKHAVAWRVVAGPVGLRNDADAFGLDAERDDLALEFGAGLLEGADGCHIVSPWLFEPATTAASMAIVSRRRSTTHPQGRSAAEDGSGETFLPREEWAQPRGRKSRRRHCGKAIEAPPSCGQIKPSRRRAGRRRTASKEKTWQRSVRARGQAQRAKQQKPWRTKRPPSHPGPGQCSHFRHRVCRLRTSCRSIEALARTALFAADVTISIGRAPNRNMTKSPQLSVAAEAAGNGDLKPAPSPAPVSGGLESARRVQAVMPAAIAPMSANTRCHGPDGTPSCARPSAAS